MELENKKFMHKEDVIQIGIVKSNLDQIVRISANDLVSSTHLSQTMVKHIEKCLFE